MEKIRLFANILIAGMMVAFIGCKKTEGEKQETPAQEVQPATHTELEAARQQTPLPANESTAPIEHEVVSTVREFLKAIEAGDYDRAIELGTPGEFKREGLIKVNDAFDFTNVGISEALVGSQNAAVLIDSISGPSGAGQFGFSLVKSGNRWLIRDVDWLPGDQAVEKWLNGFKSVEPNAKRVAGAD